MAANGIVPNFSGGIAPVGGPATGGVGLPTAPITIPPSSFPSILDRVPNGPNLTGAMSGPRRTLSDFPSSAVMGAKTRQTNGRVSGTDTNATQTTQIIATRHRLHDMNEDLTDQEFCFREKPRIIQTSNLANRQYRVKGLASMNVYLRENYLLEELKTAESTYEHWKPFGGANAVVPVDSLNRRSESQMGVTVSIGGRQSFFNIWLNCRYTHLRADRPNMYLWLMLRRYPLNDGPQQKFPLNPEKFNVMTDADALAGFGGVFLKQNEPATSFAPRQPYVVNGQLAYGNSMEEAAVNASAAAAARAAAPPSSASNPSAAAAAPAVSSFALSERRAEIKAEELALAQLQLRPPTLNEVDDETKLLVETDRGLSSNRPFDEKASYNTLYQTVLKAKTDEFQRKRADFDRRVKALNDKKKAYSAAVDAARAVGIKTNGPFQNSNLEDEPASSSSSSSAAAILTGGKHTKEMAKSMIDTVPLLGSEIGYNPAQWDKERVKKLTKANGANDTPAVTSYWNWVPHVTETSEKPDIALYSSLDAKEPWVGMCVFIGMSDKIQNISPNHDHIVREYCFSSSSIGAHTQLKPKMPRLDVLLGAKTH